MKPELFEYKYAESQTGRLYSTWVLPVLVCLFILVSFNACYFDVIVTEDLDEATEVYFGDDIVPIFQASCTSCHDGQISSPNLTRKFAYSSLINGNYISVSQPESSTLITKIQRGHPYTGAVTQVEIQKLIQWMDAGGANN